VPATAELATEFKLFVLAYVVHLHDLGEESLLHVLLNFRAFGGIAHGQIN
jgi:hypothetical protein